MKRHLQCTFCVAILFTATTAAGQVSSDNASQPPAQRDTNSTTAQPLPAVGQSSIDGTRVPAQPASAMQMLSSPVGPTTDGLLLTPQGLRFPTLLSEGAVGGAAAGFLSPVRPDTTSPSGERNVNGVADVAAPSRPCSTANGTAAAGPSSASPSFPGVSTSQFRRAGVAADAFVRPGVSTEQLASLLPGAPAPCPASRDVVLYPEPANPPRRIPTTGDEP